MSLRLIALGLLGALAPSCALVTYESAVDPAFQQPVERLLVRYDPRHVDDETLKDELQEALAERGVRSAFWKLGTTPELDFEPQVVLELAPRHVVFRDEAWTRGIVLRPDEAVDAIGVRFTVRTYVHRVLYDASVFEWPRQGDERVWRASLRASVARAAEWRVTEALVRAILAALEADGLIGPSKVEEARDA